MTQASSTTAADPSDNPPKHKFNPVREALLIGFVILFAVTHANYFLYQKALLAQKGEINDGLSMFSTVIAAYIDDDKHQKLNKLEQEKTELYQKALVPLETLMGANDSIVNAYTMVMIEDKIYFILDPTPAGDADGDGQDDKAHLMEQYESPAQELLLAFTTQTSQVTKNPYVDKWGNYFSSFSPLRDADGKMYGMLGLDVSASGYYARLKPIQRHFIRLTAASFFVSFVIGCLIWFLRNFSQVLDLCRNELIQSMEKEK
jgi:hypothetical protein